MVTGVRPVQIMLSVCEKCSIKMFALYLFFEELSMDLIHFIPMDITVVLPWRSNIVLGALVVPVVLAPFETVVLGAPVESCAWCTS